MTTPLQRLRNLANSANHAHDTVPALSKDIQDLIRMVEDLTMDRAALIALLELNGGEYRKY